jgi:hypothetical protein
MQTYSLFRIQILITGLLLFGLGAALAQSDIQAKFTPAIDQKVDARSIPAKVTSDDVSSLLAKGYVKIGTIRASHPSNKVAVPSEVLESNKDAEITRQLESAILQKAAEVGGDIVLFSKAGIPEVTDVPTGKTKIMRPCLEYRTQTVSGTPTSSTSCTTDVHGFAHCMTWNTPTTRTIQNCVRVGPPEEVPVTRRVSNNLVSEATIWRNDPTLAADVARTEKAEGIGLESALVHGADINPMDEKTGKTLLHEAVILGNRFEVERLLAHGADVNAREKTYGLTPLHEAAFNGNREMAELLLAHGADVNAKSDTKGFTPLRMGADMEHMDVVELLLAKGADVNASGDDGNTALHMAAWRGDVPMAELLLAHGADVNAKNYKDAHMKTPLCAAVFSNQSTHVREMVRMLQKHGGKIH